MRQAIQTKYLGPTNTKGARIKASCEGGSLIVSWKDNLSIDENHELAAYQLANNKLKWPRWNKFKNIASGGLKDGTCVHVLIETATK